MQALNASAACISRLQDSFDEVIPMSIDRKCEDAVKSSLLFHSLSAEEISKCTEHSLVVHLDKGQRLAMPEKLSDVYIVLSGRLNVFLDSGMNESLSHTLEKGGCFGIAFCSQDIPCHICFESTEKSTLLRIPFRSLLSYGECRDKIMENMLAITSGNLLKLSEKISHTQSHSVRVKLSVYLRDQMRRCGSGRFQLGMKRNSLAEYLCVSYPAMLRELSQLQKEGLIEIEGDTVTILNEENLIENGSDYAF